MSMPLTSSFIRIAITALALCTAVAAAPAQEREVPPTREALQYSYAPIVKKATPAVVNVYVRSRVRTQVSPFANDPFFQRFFGGRGGFGLPQERIQSSLGSGVIISADGVIVTNTHVVKGGTDTQIRVALSDKREFDARIIAQDERTDLAVLKIEKGGKDFPFLQFADSDKLEVGDLVLAIGNPFGVGQTVTSGIISALARTEMAQAETQVFLQTDAAINPGNSGGALVDMNGRLAGINTMIFSQSGGSVGIGFAIPSNLVRLYADNAVAGRKIERPWLGGQLETVTREMAMQLKLDRVSGAIVVRLTNHGPAAKAGLQLGDVIVRVDELRGRRFPLGSLPADDPRHRQQQPHRDYPRRQAHDGRGAAAAGPQARQGRRTQLVRQSPVRRRARLQHPPQRRRRAQSRRDGWGRHRRRALRRGRRAARLPAGRHHRSDQQRKDHRRHRARSVDAHAAAEVERHHQARRTPDEAANVWMRLV